MDTHLDKGRRHSGGNGAPNGAQRLVDQPVTVRVLAKVLATLAVGALLLGERVAGARQWAGLAVVAAAVLAYLALRRRAAPRPQPPVAGADDVELPRSYAPVAHSDAVGVFVIGGDDSDDDAAMA